MGSKGLVLAALVLAACAGSDIEIEIHANDDTMRVELFVVSLPMCSDCAGIRPQGATSMLAGDVYFRDPSPAFEDEVDGDQIAHFRLRSGDLGETKVEKIIAVGYGPNGVTGVALLTGFDVADGPFRLIAELDRVQVDVLSDTPPEDDRRVQVWSQGSADVAKCIGFETWDSSGGSGQRVERRFVVPLDDRDCDAVTGDKECRADEYETHVEPGLDTSSCFDRFGTADGGTACMLGGAYCVDGKGPATSCGPTGYCVPDNLCDRCAGLSPMACIGSRFEDAALQLVGPDIYCTVPVAMEMTGATLCPTAPARMNVDLTQYFTTGHTCTTVELGRPGMAGFSNMIMYGTTGKLFVAAPPASQCTFILAFEGAVPTVGLRSAVTSIEITNGKHLLMPTYVNFVDDGCQSEPECSADFGEVNGGTAVLDPMASCVL